MRSPSSHGARDLPQRHLRKERIDSQACSLIQSAWSASAKADKIVDSPAQLGNSRHVIRTSAHRHHRVDRY